MEKTKSKNKNLINHPEGGVDFSEVQIPLYPINVTFMGIEEMITPVNWLHASLLNFLKSKSIVETKWIHNDGTENFWLNQNVTLNELRPLYKAKQNINGWKGFLFNSDWNRDPNLDIPSVFVDKMGYIIRIGTGLASTMLLTVSYVTGLEEVGVFWAKDRGHLFECALTNYTEQFLIINWNKVLKKERDKITEGETLYKKDADRNIAIEIIDEISLRLKEHKKMEKKRVGTQAKDCTISLEEICMLVPEFNEFLNLIPRSLEVKKESLWLHIKEIWHINNLVNKWIEFQNALMNFKRFVFESLDKTFLSQKLQLQVLMKEIDKNEVWKGMEEKKEPKYIAGHRSIKLYKGKVTNYEEIVPIRAFGIDTYLGKDGYSVDNKTIWQTEKNQDELTKHLKSIYKNRVVYKDASDRINLYSRIVKIGDSYFKDFHIYKNKLLKKVAKENPEWNTTNIEHCNIDHEHFSTPVIVGIARICGAICNGRSSATQIRTATKAFCENMESILKDASTDKDFIGGSATMAERFKFVILPTYQDTYDAVVNKSNISKEKIKEIHLEEVRDEYFSKSDGKKFKVFKLNMDSYSSLPEICVVDYDNGDGWDLGQRIATMGYTLENCIPQQKYHNRSKNKTDHDVSNLDYALSFVKEQWEMADKLYTTNELSGDMSYMEVYFDIKKLAEIFKVID